MRTLGIVGGIGPESTIEYYRAILDAVRHRHGETTAPPIIINSIDVHKVLRLAGAGDLAALASYLEQELGRLVRAGADAAIMAANTPHAVFDDLVSRCSIPLISIVEATASVAKAQGLGRLGLLGTRSTMEGQFFPDVFAKHGMRPSGGGTQYRASVIGPGVTPDVMWSGPAPARATAAARAKSAAAIRAMGDPSCRA